MRQNLLGFVSKRRLAVVTCLVWASLGSSNGSAAVLYDQTTGTPTGLVQTVHGVADDITVPPGPAWAVNSIQIEGQGSGVGFIYGFVKDAGGSPELLPGGLVGGQELWAYEDPPGVNDFDLPFRSGNLEVPVILPPGRYWLTVYTAFSMNSWAWRAQSPRAGYEGAIAHVCVPQTWKHLSECGQPGPDLRFRVNGGPFTSTFQLGPPHSKPNGGLKVTGTFPGAGKVKIRNNEGLVKSRKKSLSKGKEVKLQINPTGKAKTALRRGEKVKTRVAISYTRTAGSFSAPVKVRRLQVVLRKP